MCLEQLWLVLNQGPMHMLPAWLWLACSCPWAIAAEREAGYILLGAMCAAAPPSLLAGRQKQQEIFQLFGVALGQPAADALSGAGAGAGSVQGAAAAAATAAAAAAGAAAAGSPGVGGLASGDTELELAVACWWRAAALQALSAYVLGVMGKGFAQDPAQQVRV